MKKELKKFDIKFFRLNDPAFVCFLSSDKCIFGIAIKKEAIWV